VRGPAPVPARFYGLLALAVLGLSAGYAALVLYSASWPAAAALRPLYSALYDWRPRAYTAGGFAGLRLALAGLATVALGLATALGIRPAGRAQLRALGQEVRSAARGLGAGWQELTPGQRRGALLVLLVLTAWRGYYSLRVQPYDDAFSYELFVRESWLAVTAAYPIPNNHVLSNTVAWVFYQAHPGFWWSMRLPVLLTATGATALWFLALLRRSNFRVALLGVGWFCLPLESLYYAATGRGYWLLVGLGAVGFFATLALRATPRHRPRAAAAALVVSGVLGLYTVPTHLLLLAPAYGWWAWGAVRRRDGPALARLLALGVLTGLATALLYAPLLLLSGPGLLLHHRYIAPLTPAEFWHYVVANARQPYQLLWGPLTLAALGGLGLLVRRARAGQLPADQARLVQQLGLPSAWLMLTPYLISVAQRSYPPERTLLYKAQYTFLLLALAADWALRQPRPAQRRWVVGALGALSLAFAGLQGWRVARQEQLWRRSLGAQRARPGAEWLSRQPPGPVLAPDPLRRFGLRFYGRVGFPGPPWHLDAYPRPGVRYRYLVAAPGERPEGLRSGPPAFSGPVFDIFVVF
jgi:hypothetical protein